LRNLLYVLQSPSEDELIHLQQYLPSVEELEISGFTDAELRAYDKFWDSVSVERTLLDDRYQKGREEGREEGINQRSLEIARNMLAKGMDASTVLEITGLSMEEIQ
jgi:predicted transposase/invertase (TIGR01784 family)